MRRLIGLIMILFSVKFSFMSQDVGVYYNLPANLQGTSWLVIALFGLDWMVRK